jgi:hypothetical protein
MAAPSHAVAGDEIKRAKDEEAHPGREQNGIEHCISPERTEFRSPATIVAAGV